MAQRPLIENLRANLIRIMDERGTNAGQLKKAGINLGYEIDKNTKTGPGLNTIERTARHLNVEPVTLLLDPDRRAALSVLLDTIYSAQPAQLEKILPALQGMIEAIRE